MLSGWRQVERLRHTVDAYRDQRQCIDNTVTDHVVSIRIIATPRSAPLPPVEEVKNGRRSVDRVMTVENMITFCEEPIVARTNAMRVA